MFERFELLGSLAQLEQKKPIEVQAELDKDPPHDYVWISVGRPAWHSQNREKLLAEIRNEPVKAALTKAGFAQRNPAFVGLFISNFERMIARIPR